MNENEIQVWNCESSEIRTVQVNGEPWFVLADVCKVLELSSPHKVADRLENDERNQIPVTDSLGRYQNTAIINESGLYTVILRSDKPQANRSGNGSHRKCFHPSGNTAAIPCSRSLQIYPHSCKS